ncbi:50S ribosomal protein L18 [Candidatus Microgenomates bacterium]|jgi:large subunit ribosomal protein L18|nr:MAG: 50S ribosomal protein L18 [Candidatus Microgenomates bacterium]
MENKRIRALKRKTRVRSKMPAEGFRLSVSRSNRYLFAQVIDQKSGKTVLGLSDKKIEEKELKGKTKSEKAKVFGQKFAEETVKQKIKRVIFDRGPYRYHGRIKAFAEGVREGGLEY